MEIQSLLTCATAASGVALGIYTGYILLYYWRFHTLSFKALLMLQFMLCLIFSWLHTAHIDVPLVFGHIGPVQWELMKTSGCLLLLLGTCIGHARGLHKFRLRETNRLEHVQILKLFVLLQYRNNQQAVEDLVQANSTAAVNLLYSKQCGFLTRMLGGIFMAGLMLCSLMFMLSILK